MVEKINTTNDQNAETNVDWLQNGERTNETNLNRPVKQVAEKVNELIDYVDDSKADLQSQIDERVSIDMSLSSLIDAEAAARTNADGVLQSNIDAEAAARTNADGVLQSNIDAEIQNRTDADNTLQSNIDAESLYRTNGHNALRSYIDLEKSERILADNELLNAINIASNSINQLNSLKPTSSAIQSGFLKIPSSGITIIIQWGKVDIGDISNSNASWRNTITFHTAFPTTCLSIQCTIEERKSDRGTRGSFMHLSVSDVTKTGFISRTEETVKYYQKPSIRYLAIGY